MADVGSSIKASLLTLTVSTRIGQGVARMVSITLMLAMASSIGTDTSVSSRMARANKLAWIVYWSAAGKATVSVVGATGGSPPCVTKILV